MPKEELKVKIGNHLEQHGISDEATKDQMIAELDCLANLIIDSFVGSSKK